jgi:gluconate 5-dehydrogenase
MEVSLKGKVALVTGASRGIGLAIAKTFAESGASVMMVSRKIDESAMQGIEGEVAIRPANVGDPTAATDVVRETIAKFGRLDILVNNAATNPYYGPTMGVDEGRYDKTFQINLKAPLQWTQAAYEASFKENPGVIINIASVAGIKAEPPETLDAVGYSTSKGAVIQLTRDLAMKWGRYGIRVNALAPGFFPTRMTEKVLPKIIDSFQSKNALGRPGIPGELGGCALFFASAASDYVNGDVMVVNGGPV